MSHYGDLAVGRGNEEAKAFVNSDDVPNFLLRESLKYFCSRRMKLKVLDLRPRRSLITRVPLDSHWRAKHDSAWF